MADGAPALPENTPPTAHDIKAATRGAVTDVDAQNPVTPPTTSVAVLSPVGSPSVVAAEPRDVPPPLPDIISQITPATPPPTLPNGQLAVVITDDPAPAPADNASAAGTPHDGPNNLLEATVESALVIADPAIPGQPTRVGAAGIGFSMELVMAMHDSAQQQVVCFDCQEECDPLKSRLLHKGKGNFRCKKCWTTYTKVYQAMGGGMAKQIAEIPDDVRTQFFKDAKDKTGKDVTESLTHHLDNHSTWGHRYEMGGVFKPLSVWATLGYPVDRISEKSLPQDVRPDRMFDYVYRVPELAVHEVSTKGRASRCSVTAAQSNPRHAKRNRTLMDHVALEADEVPAVPGAGIAF